MTPILPATMPSQTDQNVSKSLISAPLVSGAALFVLACTFYYFAVLDLDYKKSSLLNLDPHPDSSEYFAQAVTLAKGEQPLIRIGYDKLPSAFPPGYSALMVPWLKLLPQSDSILAPFRTNQTLGLVMLCVSFGLYLYLGMPLAGGFATLLLATLPGFFTFCRSSISDVSAWLLYALAFIFAYLGLKEERRWKIYLSAAFLGLSFNVRLQSIFFLPLLLAMPLFPVRQAPWRWFIHCVGAGMVFVLAMSPLLLVNILQSHSPFKIGGDFWYPPRKLFGFEYIFSQNLAMFWRELTLRPIGFFGANIFGTGTVFVAAFVVLICLGFFFIRWTRAALCLGLADLGFFCATACYRYPNGRYYLQLLILLIPVAVLPLSWAAANLSARKQIVASIGIFVVFVAACLGYPSRSGHKTRSPNRSQAWEGIRYRSARSQSRWFTAEKQFMEKFRDRPGIVLSDIDPVYLNALWPDSFIAAPIDEDHIRRYSRAWHYGPAEAATLVRRGIEQSIPVYALFVSRKQVAEQAQRLPKVDGYEWSQIHERAGDVVLRLTSVKRNEAAAAQE